MVGIKKQGSEKQLILVFIILLVHVLVISCGEHAIEPKYADHHSYSAFLEYLKVNTDTMDDDLKKVSFIRRKTAELIDCGFGANDVKKIDDHWAEWPGERYYSVFYFDSATVTCGGSALFLARVYNDLGFTSATYDMGCAGEEGTHQVTLVTIKSDVFVEDAFFNSSFEDRQTGKELSFDSLLKLLEAQQRDRIKVVQDGYNFIPDFDTTKVKETSGDSEEGNSEKVAYMQIERKYTLVEGVNTSFRQSVYDCLEKNGLPRDFLYLYLLEQPNDLK